LGASPDAVLIHRLNLQPDDLQAAARLLAPADNSDSTPNSRRSPAENEAAAVQLLLQRGFERLQCTGFKPQASGVQYEDSSSEGEATPSSMQDSSSSSSEAGVSAPASSADDSMKGDEIDSAQHDKQHAAGLNGHHTSLGKAGSAGHSPLDIEQAGSLAFEPVAVSVLRVLRDWQQQQQQQQRQQQQPISLVVREAVEVKNHCPFGIR
jgi:hypothetical protein